MLHLQVPASYFLCWVSTLLIVLCWGGGQEEKETNDRHSFNNRFNENCKESDNKILQPTKIFLLAKPQIIQT